ncbi:MAG: zinc-ribbon domain-containing protein [Lachnospiraceae bacterium]
MFCGNCGTENANGAKFCKSCGKPLGNAPTIQKETKQDGSAPVLAAAKVDTSQFTNKLKAIPAKVLIACGCGLIALIVIICLAVNIRSTINLNKYITVEATGYDGYGRADVEIDWDAIEEKYGDKISFTNKAVEEYGEWIKYLSPVEALEGYVSVSLDNRDNLSNGDEITYSWDIDEELSKYLKCKVKYKDSTYEISELQPVGTFDPFADLTVSFDGFAPNGRVQYEYSGEELSTYDFNCDSYSGLRNGDVVKIYINENYVEYFAENLGKVPSSLEKEYTVEGLDEYIESYSDLPEDFIATLRNESEDSIYAYVANTYSSSMSMSNLSYAGYIMNEIIDGSSYGSIFNDLYVIYSGTVSNANNDFATTTVYYPVRFTNIMRSNGSMSFDENRGIVGISYFNGSWNYSTRGYISPLNCYLDVIESYGNAYRTECGDGFEVYSNYEVVTELNGFTDSFKNLVQETAKTDIENYIAGSYSESSQATDLMYVGEYLLTAKSDDVSVADKNKYIVVFSATVSNSKGGFETATVYFPVQYRGIVKLPGDEFVVTEADGIKGHFYFPDSYYATDGYLDGYQMYNDLVTAYREKYTYEISEGLQQFGN